MANNGARIPVPQITDLSREELESWRAVSDHPLLDGQLVEDITLSTTTKYTRVPHALGRPYRGFIDVRGVGLTEDQSNPNKDKEIWLYREAAPILIDTVEVTTATGSVVFSGLSGDRDKQYEITGHVENSSTVFTLEPNELTTNQDGQKLLALNTTVSASTEASWVIFDGSSNFNFHARIYAETGELRGFTAQCVTKTASPATAYHAYSGVWSNTSTEITSLAIKNSSTGIGAGSWFKLYALNSRATKSAIWIF